MQERELFLTPQDPTRLYPELIAFLSQHRESELRSKLFIVEGTLEKPIIGIRYPGRKLQRRVPKSGKTTKSFIEWANLGDFEVVLFDEKGTDVTSKEFAYRNMLKDFEEHKKNSVEFWSLIEKLHKDKTVEGPYPSLPGIPSDHYLLMLKWMWIQEDLNYKYSSAEVESPIPYMLLNLKGKPTAKGAGRGKFYAALHLVHENIFTAAEVSKIIP